MTIAYLPIVNDIMHSSKFPPTITRINIIHSVIGIGVCYKPSVLYLYATIAINNDNQSILIMDHKGFFLYHLERNASRVSRFSDIHERFQSHFYVDRCKLMY